jgi:RNA polymerase sigma factor (TIGR02999 family)
MAAKINVNETLASSAEGDDSGAEALMEVVYNDLRRVAASMFAQESAGNTLQPTALVHEAYLRLADQNATDWKGRSHFMAIGARMMRRILVDHARQRKAAKRGKGFERIPFEDNLLISPREDVDVLAVNEALERLAKLNEDQARIVELRFFGGMTMDEIAETLRMSVRSVGRHWRFTRAWLRKEIAKDMETGAADK